MNNTSVKRGIVLAVIAAAFYAINAPVSKVLLDYMPPTLMAGFLYVGAGVGMGVIALVRKATNMKNTEATFSRSDIPYIIAMILLDIAAPICLMFGLSSTSAASASLLNNFEIVATALIALLVFKERISLRLWFGILFITLSCAILSFEVRITVFFWLLICVDCMCFVGRGEQLYQKDFLKRSIADSIVKGNILRHRFNCGRFCNRGTDNCRVERLCSIGRGICCLRS